MTPENSDGSNGKNHALETKPGRRVTEREARWIAQVEVGPELNLLRAEMSVKRVEKVNQPGTISAKKVNQPDTILDQLIEERKGLRKELKLLYGDQTSRPRRKEIARRVGNINQSLKELRSVTK